MNYTIKSDNMTYVISSRGAELISAKDDTGTEFIWQADPEVWGAHAPLLFPVCGRIKNSRYLHDGKWYEMGIHGFLSSMEFEEVEYTENSLTLTTKSNEKTRASYPFDFSFKASYITENGKLKCAYFVKNDGNLPMPYAFGLHPGFNIFTEVADYKVIFDREDFGRRMKVESGRDSAITPIHLPGGVLDLDEEEIYRIDTIILKYPGTTARLVSDAAHHEVSLEFSEELGFFCIWKAARHEAKYLCLEPWTATPTKDDGEEVLKTRHDMINLAPGESNEYTLNISITKS